MVNFVKTGSFRDDTIRNRAHGRRVIDFDDEAKTIITSRLNLNMNEIEKSRDST